MICMMPEFPFNRLDGVSPMFFQRRLSLYLAVAIALAWWGYPVSSAWAHERIEVGPYLIIVGWVEEPVIVADTDVKVEIETEGFELGADGNHWHIFVDGESRGMITGTDHDEVVRGLEPGEHHLGAFLSNGAHEELEDGATITITVVE
jgi:hypothetical protein